MNNSVSPFFLLFIANMLLPLLALIGVFDERDGNRISFCPRKFMPALAFALAVNIASGVYLVQKIHMVFENSGSYMIKTFYDHREGQDYFLDAMQTLFPDRISNEGRACIEKAVARYVEDRWNETFAQASCKEQCAADAVAMTELLLGDKSAPNLRRFWLTERKVEQVIEQTAGKMYTLQRKLGRATALSASLGISSPSPERAQFVKYIEGCSDESVTPAWAQSGYRLWGAPDAQKGVAP